MNTGPVPRDQRDADAELMLRFQSGDEAAFAALVRSYQNRIVSLAYRYLGSAADAEDLAQEVFLRVYRAKESYEPTAKFSTWVYRITSNASLNFLRGRKARRGVSGTMPVGGAPADYEDEDAEAPDERMEKDELARVLRRIVDELPERQRMAIVLNKYEGLCYDDVASAMDMSVMAVKSLLTRARVNIKEKLVPYLSGGDADSAVGDKTVGDKTVGDKREVEDS
jgi:RNA polymerase sigma-70 factor (ECF subfamily)